MTATGIPEPIHPDDTRDGDGTIDGRQGIQSVEIAMDVLMALERGGGPMSLSAIAQAVGSRPSKVHRYLVSSGRVGLTSQDSKSGLYDFGPAMRRLGSEALRRTNEVSVAETYAVNLRDRTGHSVNVAVWGDRGPIVVNWAYGTHPLSLTVRIGATLPLLASSIGHVFLAFLPDSLTGDALSQELAGAEGSRWTRARVAAMRTRVRSEGYAVTSGGVLPGIASVAAPVFAVNDPMPLAMSVVLPDQGSSPEHLAALTSVLTAAVADASRELGHHR